MEIETLGVHYYVINRGHICSQVWCEKRLLMTLIRLELSIVIIKGLLLWQEIWFNTMHEISLRLGLHYFRENRPREDIYIR